MKPKRFYFIMIGATTLLSLLVLASAIGGDILFTKEAKKLSDLKVQSKVVEEQQTALVQAKKDIEKYAELDKIARAVVPQDKDQAKTIREINAIAAQSGIQLKNITFTSSTLGQAPAPAPKTEGSDKPNPQAAQPGVSQTKSVEGIPGVYALEIVISPSDDQPVPYYRFIDFLEKLEGNRRTAHVSKITVTPIEGSFGISFILTLNAYVKP